jgi:hypothetical protein
VFYVYKHNGDPEGSLREDPTLGPEGGFETADEADFATKDLFPSMHLVMLRGRYSGVIVAIRRPGAAEWTHVP